jgi:hypothetical protein
LELSWPQSRVPGWRACVVAADINFTGIVLIIPPDHYAYP